MENLSNSHRITSDSETLQTVAGLPIELAAHSALPSSDCYCSFLSREIVVLERDVDTLIDKCVILQSSLEERELTSPVFLLPKEDNSFRTILNLKKLNVYTLYPFKWVPLTKF